MWPSEMLVCVFFYPHELHHFAKFRFKLIYPVLESEEIACSTISPEEAIAKTSVYFAEFEKQFYTEGVNKL